MLHKIESELRSCVKELGYLQMTAEEAAEAAALIKPTIAVPMHYGSVVGKDEDAKYFVKLCEENGIKAEILEKS